MASCAYDLLSCKAFVCAENDEIMRAMLEGVEGIRREFEANGTEEAP